MYQITTGHITAHVALPDTVDPASAALPTQLPGGWHTEPKPGIAVAAVDVRLGPPDITVDADTVQVRLPSATAGSVTLGYVVYGALERARQLQRRITVHASAVHNPDQCAVVLLGGKGSGKTGTALALAERGWTHAGDDLVVFDQTHTDLRALPGKPTAAIRDLADPLAPKQIHTLTPFAEQGAPVARIVRLVVHPDITRAEIRCATPFTANEALRLHEDLARYISGIPTPLTGAATPYGPVWPIDTREIAGWRAQLLAELERHRFEYLYAPDPHTAADLLTRTGSYT